MFLTTTFATALTTVSIAQAVSPRQTLPPIISRCVESIDDLRALPIPAVNPPQRPTARALGHWVRDDGGGGVFYWDRSSGRPVDDGIVFTSTDPFAPSAGRWIRVIDGPIRGSWWGLAGDGSDETQRLQAAFDAAAGRTLTFDGPAVYGFLPPLTIHPGTRIENNGATLRLLADPGGAATGVNVGDDVQADLLQVNVAAGVPVRRLLTLGHRNDVRRLVISSDDQQTAFVNNLDGAVQIRTTEVRIGSLVSSKFDRPVVAYQDTHTVIESLQVTDYITGLLIRESEFFQLLSAQITQPAPGATTVPGHNGILMSGDDITLSDVLIHDSGEHGIRVGGVPSARLMFDNIQVIRPGQCGLKISAADVRDVQINGLTVVDAAATSTPGTNEDGLRLENCSYVTVNGLQVQNRDRAVSAYVGLYINSCDHVTVNGPRITSTASHGIHLQDIDSTCNQIFINQPAILVTGGDGIAIHSPTQILRDITVMGCFIRGQSGWGISVVANAASVGVNQPMVLDGWIKNDGLGGYWLGTTDPDIHTNLSIVN